MPKAKTTRPNTRNISPVAKLGLNTSKGVFRLMVLVCFIGVSVWVISFGGYQKSSDFVTNQFVQISTESGFIVKDVLIEGRHNADLDLIRNMVNIHPGDPIFMLNPVEASQNLEKISWVKDAVVVRKLPDIVEIRLNERLPLALFKGPKGMSLIDKEGLVLTRQNFMRFKDYLIVKGQGADTNAHDLMKKLSLEGQISKEVETASFIGERRWNLGLKNGMVVKLPETDISFALKKMVDLMEAENILNKKIKVIDLRQSDRVVVRTMSGAQKEFEGVKQGI